MSKTRSILYFAIIAGILLVLFPFLAKAAAPTKWELVAHIMIKIYLNIAFGLCLWIMLQAGMLSLGQGAFIALGAYVTGIFSVKYQLVNNLWVCYLTGALFAALLAFLLGLITVRHYKHCPSSGDQDLLRPLDGLLLHCPGIFSAGILVDSPPFPL
jgi:ABC-type branched-subunit amino acid transport system permease subunit